MRTSTCQFAGNTNPSSVSPFRGKPTNFRSFHFGLSLSPRVFTRVVAAALAPLQRRGLKIMPYLDDWLVCAQSRQQVVEDTEWVLSHIQSLGLQANLKKSDLNPRQETAFLGLCLNSLTMRASLTPQRVAGIQAALHAFRRGRRIELLSFQKDVGVNVSSSNGGPVEPSQGPTLAVLAECFQPSPTTAQAPKAQGDPVMWAGSDTLAGRPVANTGDSPGQGTFQKDAGVHGGLPDRLGSSLGGSDSEGQLGTPVGQRACQCPGAKSNTPRPEGTSSLYTGQACARTYGQLFSRLPCQSPRGHTVSALP